MDSNRIDELLARYWECETSLEEENELHAYFNTGNVDERHKEAASLFQYFALNRKKSIEDDSSFDPRRFNGTPAAPRGKVVQLVYNTLRIAAGVAVLMVAIYFVRTEIRKSDPVAAEDTYSDPKLAFEETKRALMMISNGFTKAENEAKKINLFNEAREEIQKEESKESAL